MNTTEPIAPTTPTQTQKTTVENEAQPYDSNPFTISFKGFSLLAEFAKSVIITMVIIGGFGMVTNVAGNFSQDFESENEISSSATQTISDPISAGEILPIVTIAIGIIFVIFLVSIIVTTAYGGFVAAGAVAASEKRTITFGEAFNAMADRFGTLFKAQIITSLKILGGFLLFIVPGIRGYLRYQAVPYLIMADSKLTASESIQKAKTLYDKHLMEVFGIVTVGSIIPFIGNAFAAGGIALSIQQLKAYQAANAQTPKTHWLNYLGIIFLAFIALAAAVMFLLLLAIFIPLK